MFQTELDVDETLAQLLVAEGFGALEEVAYVELDELSSIEGFDDELATELQSRAQEALDRREEAAREERRGMGVSDELAEMPYLTEAMLVTLGKAGIKTLDDLADLATDELVQKKRPEQRRQNVVHIAMIDRGAAARVRHALDRWRAFIEPGAGLDAATAGTPDASAKI